MNDDGDKVCGFNRTVTKVTYFIHNEAKGTNVLGCTCIEEFIIKLKRPRKIVILVKSSGHVGAMIGEMVGLLEASNLDIDEGN